MAAEARHLGRSVWGEALSVCLLYEVVVDLTFVHFIPQTRFGTFVVAWSHGRSISEMSRLAVCFMAAVELQNKRCGEQGCKVVVSNFILGDNHHLSQMLFALC